MTDKGRHTGHDMNNDFIKCFTDHTEHLLAGQR